MNVADVPGRRETGEPPIRLIDAAITVRIFWRPILVAFLLPVILGFGAALSSKPRFVAETILMVLVNRETSSAPDLTGFGPSVISVEMLKVIRAELEILQGQATIRMALQRLGPEKLYPGVAESGGFWRASALSRDEQLDISTELFQKSLRADTDTNSNLLRVNFSFPDRLLAIEALSYLVDAYLERRDILLNGTSSRILGAELVRYESQLSETEKDIQRVRANYGVLDISQEFQLATSRRDSIMQRLDSVREQRVAIAAQLSVAQSLQLNQPARIPLELDSTNNFANDEGRNILARLMQERQHMASAYTADYTPLRDLDRRITATRQSLQETALNTISTSKQGRNPQLDTLSQRIIGFQLDASGLAEQEKELELQRQASAARASSLREAEVKLRELQRRRDGMEAVVRQLTTHEAGIRIAEDPERSHNPNVRVVQAANAPLNGRSIRRVLVAGGGALGMFGAAALALILTLTRRVFATADEVERSLGLSVFRMTVTGNGGKKTSIALDDMPDLAAFLLDATALGQPIRLVQLVPADDDGQASTLGMQLCSEIAGQVSGDVLLIDLDRPEPAEHRSFSSGPEIAERWISEIQVMPSTVPRLFRAGPTRLSPLIDPHVPHAKAQLQLSELRASFRMVIVVASVNSQSYAARRLTGLVDTNLLVVRALSTRIRVARWLRDLIVAANAPKIGVVFTGRPVVLPAAVERWV